MDYETIETNVRLAKQNQALGPQPDQNKAFREHARIENAVTSYNEAFLQSLSSTAQLLLIALAVRPLDPLLLHSLSICDNHFNELVNLPTNRFDFEVAAKRLHF